MKKQYMMKDPAADALSLTHLSSVDAKDARIKTNSSKKSKHNRKHSNMDDDLLAKNTQEFNPKMVKLPPYKSIYNKATLETFP